MRVPVLGTLVTSLENVKIIPGPKAVPGKFVVTWGGQDKQGKSRKVAYLSVASPSLTTSSRADAVKELVISPLTLPIQAVMSVAGALLNAVTLGQMSVICNRVENTPCGRLKGIGCSALSVALTPVAFLVSAVARLAHVFSPKPTFLDALEAHLWTGFVAVHKPQD